MYSFYWLPIGTDVRVRGVPWATLCLVVASFAAFALIHALPGGEALVYRLAFTAGRPTVATAIASLFLHVSPFHLLANMLFLAVFGPPLEARLGAGRYLVAYIACGWLANLAQAAWILAWARQLAALPLIGATGCAAGLGGLYLVRLHFSRLRFASLPLLFARGIVKPARLEVPAAGAIALWLALNAAYQAVRGAPETAPICLVSGFLFGAFFAWAMGLAPEGSLEQRFARGVSHASRGEWFAALADLEAYLDRAPDDPEAMAHAARIHRVTHQEARAAERFRESIHLWLERGALRDACDTYEEMKRLLGPVAIDPSDLLRLARGCEELARPGEASRAYEAYGRQYPDRVAAAVALLKSAEIERRMLDNPARARYIYDELLRRPLRPGVERLVRERAAKADAALARRN
jgi:membrane associated rhomboid family serine protease